jgi:Tol biopolymer transport system component
VPFTTYPGIEGAPSFSPDGSQIVFHWCCGEEGEYPLVNGLYIKQLGNEKAVRLTDDSSCVVPAWSPDGRSIAFSRWRLNGSGIDSGIYIVPSLGGPVRKLATTQAGCDRLSWSSDSTWLAFPDFDSKVDAPLASHLYLLNVNTLERRMLPHPFPNCKISSEPAFSPDGKSLARACMTSYNIGGIFVEPAAGGPAREIVHFEGNLQGIAWATDGRSLVYSLDGGLWRVPAGGGIPEQLPRAQHAFGLDIARNGERLAYSQVEQRQNIWRLNLMSPTKASGAPTKLIASTGLQSGPRISPDGRHIAFESTRSGSVEIWLCDSDGSNPIQMTFFKTPLTGTARWSPDSRHLVFDSRATGHPQLYVLDIDGGPPRLLRTTGTPDAAGPFWSADGRWIYFSSGQPAIWKVLADGGNAVRLSDTDGFNPQESADGARIYFVRGNDRMDVWWVPAAGGSSRRLEGMPTLVSGDHWTPSKHGIYFIDGAADPATLNLFDPNNRHITRVAALSGLFDGWGPGLNVSNDGHTVLYAKGDGGAADIMLIEGFR